MTVVQKTYFTVQSHPNTDFDDVLTKPFSPEKPPFQRRKPTQSTAPTSPAQPSPAPTSSTLPLVFQPPTAPPVTSGSSSSSASSSSLPSTYGDDEYLLTNLPIATEYFPDWFVNASPKYRKIVRVLGATVNWVNQDDYVMSDPVPLNPGYRLFSNIVTSSNLVMKTIVVTDEFGVRLRYTGNEGFVMMVNNYNSVKEYDITHENIRKIELFLRPWHMYTQQVPESPIDFVCELELLLVDEST